MEKPDLVAASRNGSRRACTVIAHRGASACYPENTIPAFEAAVELGAHMIELDVQLSRDGEVVVSHDETLARCTDGRGTVAGRSLAELKWLDAGSWFGKDFEGTKIPTLEEVLSLCRGRIAVNVEIKTEAVTDRVAGGIEEKCLDLVAARGMGSQVVFSSFDPRALRHLRHIDGTAAIAVLYDKKACPSRLPSEIVTLFAADFFNCSCRELDRKRWADLNWSPFFWKHLFGRKGVILVHGYMAAPEEIRPLAEYLYRHGGSVYGARPRGHGMAPEDLAIRNWEKLMKAVEKRLGDVTDPVPVVQGNNDPVVNPVSGREIFKKLGSEKKRFLAIEADHHGILWTEEAEEVEAEVLDFLNSRWC